jgi:hypothetical protein
MAAVTCARWASLAAAVVLVGCQQYEQALRAGHTGRRQCRKGDGAWTL